MNVNVYLPDDLGKRAKESDLPLSRLLRDAVVDELDRRSAMQETLKAPQVYEVTLEDNEGRAYTGRITGTRIAEHRDVQVFVTDDERVLAYDEARSAYFTVVDPVEELREWLDEGAYAEAMFALGETPAIDI